MSSAAPTSRDRAAGILGPGKLRQLEEAGLRVVDGEGEEVESAFLLTCGGCGRVELWPALPEVEDRGECSGCGRFDFDWQRIVIPRGPAPPGYHREGAIDG